MVYVSKECYILCKDIDDYILDKLKNHSVVRTLDPDQNRWKIRNIPEKGLSISLCNPYTKKFNWRKQKLIPELY